MVVEKLGYQPQFMFVTTSLVDVGCWRLRLSEGPAVCVGSRAEYDAVTIGRPLADDGWWPW